MIYLETECPAGKFRCGKFAGYSCKCGCGRDCSRWGWCGKGGLYASTRRAKYSDYCQAKRVDPVHKLFYTEAKCPKGASRCGDFGDFKCKCDCGRSCSRWGWCGTSAA